MNKQTYYICFHLAVSHQTTYYILTQHFPNATATYVHIDVKNKF
jgi:hypothetical protein